MPQDSPGNPSLVLWTGKPWILPSILARTILTIVIAGVISWLEFLFGIAFSSISGLPILSLLPIVLWTNLVLFLIWACSMVHLILIRASNAYILKNDGIEIRVGIFSSKSFVIAPAGFSDLEVIRSVTGRVMNRGDIVIRTQGERDMKMERVKNPLKVADQIREVMARPIVRIEEQRSTGEEKQPQR